MCSQTTTEAETSPSSPFKPLKRLFLDVDGVLNNKMTTEKCGRWTGVSRELSLRFALWRHRHGDMEVILSSTWREDSSMWQHLRDAGIEWSGMTEVNDLGRPAQIANYNQDHPIEGYAILDDQDYGWFPYQRPFFVQTSEHFGVTPDTLKALDRVLGYD